MMSSYDVTRISHAVEGGKYKRRAHMNLRAAVIWVFWYIAFGSISKPQTLYFGCLSACLGTSIIRINSWCMRTCIPKRRGDKPHYPQLCLEIAPGM